MKMQESRGGQRRRRVVGGSSDPLTANQAHPTQSDTPRSGVFANGEQGMRRAA